jgi:hypothetical protein
LIVADRTRVIIADDCDARGFRVKMKNRQRLAFSRVLDQFD